MMAPIKQEEEKAQWVTTTQAIKLLEMPSMTFYRRLKHYKFKTRKRNGRDARITYVDLTEIKRTLNL